jgi:D-arabinose 1-dehydrogenase-like Zn-dependent alcohol dehydrogenase
MAGKFDGIMDSMEKRLGIQQIQREAANQDQNSISDNLQQIALGLGGTSTVIAKAFKDVVNNIPNMVKDFILGTKIETMTVGTITEGVANDAVMINDGISFNPRDKFRTINDGMTVAGTNVGGLDRYAAQLEKRDRAFEQNMTRLMSKMATTIKDAIQQARLQVNVDRTFGGSSLNPRGKYGAM